MISYESRLANVWIDAAILALATVEFGTLIMRN